MLQFSRENGDVLFLFLLIQRNTNEKYNTHVQITYISGKTHKYFNKWKICTLFLYLPNFFVQATYDTRSIFKQCLTDLNSKFYF